MRIIIAIILNTILVQGALALDFEFTLGGAFSDLGRYSSNQFGITQNISRLQIGVYGYWDQMTYSSSDLEEPYSLQVNAKKVMLGYEMAEEFEVHLSGFVDSNLRDNSSGERIDVSGYDISFKIYDKDFKPLKYITGIGYRKILFDKKLDKVEDDHYSSIFLEIGLAY